MGINNGPGTRTRYAVLEGQRLHGIYWNMDEAIYEAYLLGQGKVYLHEGSRPCVLPIHYNAKCFHSTMENDQ